MNRIVRTVFLAAIAASPAFSQHPQPPETPPQTNEIVLGAYNFSTNGDSGVYDLVPNDPSATRHETEHSVWKLTFRKMGTAYCLLPQLTSWKHTSITTKTKLNQITTIIQTSIPNRASSPPPSPTPCNQSRAQTFPMDSTGTLIVTAVEPLVTAPGMVHKLYRALALSSGSSLPEIAVQTDTTVTNLKGQQTSPPTSVLQILKASMLIKRWDKATWTTAYSGSISAQNDGDGYTTPEGDEWLTITANWNLQPN